MVGITPSIPLVRRGQTHQKRKWGQGKARGRCKMWSALPHQEGRVARESARGGLRRHNEGRGSRREREGAQQVGSTSEQGEGNWRMDSVHLAREGKR